MQGNHIERKSTLAEPAATASAVLPCTSARGKQDADSNFEMICRIARKRHVPHAAMLTIIVSMGVGRSNFAD
jgi:hypothetical protein